ncbi:hypothetical protein [Streptomyces sp. NPDC001750]|uniref:hypothetical protein n=1 Tax=Streptomyces sp. NPDC001750 TaxID=3364607 RepID=UPI0036990FEE
MTSTPQPSGVDLARQALLAAREAAKQAGHARKNKPGRRTGATLRRDGREPLGLGSAISRMMTERGLVAPAAGGNLMARFDTVLAAAAPELPGGSRPWRSTRTPAAWTSSPTPRQPARSSAGARRN